MAEFRNNDANNASVGKVSPSSSSETNENKKSSGDAEKNKKTGKNGKKEKDEKLSEKNAKDEAKADKEAEKSQKESDKKEKSTLQKAKDVKKWAGRGAGVAKTGMQLAFLTKMMNFTMMLAALIVQGVTAAVGGIVGFIAGIINAVVGFFSAVGTAIAGFFGFVGSAAAAAATAIFSVSIFGVIGALIVGLVAGTSNTRLGGELIDCREKVFASQIMVGDVDAKVEANARAAYSVFSAYGLTDECIAGILGNWVIESQIDPTCIEGIYDEPHDASAPRKTKARADLHSHTINVVFKNYKNSGMWDEINEDGYKGLDGYYYPGLGLGQWTGPGAQTFLNVAASIKRDWWDLDFQLAYCLSKHYRPDFFPDWRDNPSDTAEEAAIHFAHYWEGNTTMAMDERQEEAAKWYERIKGWTVDSSYADSVLALANEIGAAATDGTARRALDDCVKMYGYDNSTIAAAAASYAYPIQSMGEGNNGTPLYVRVHDAVYPGDPYYMSCDRGVACAVRWSGSDDDYPAGSTTEQYKYLKSSPKWKSVGMAGSLSMSDLSPGDVFMLDGHTFLYVSEEIVQKHHKGKADPKSDSVSASFEERSPGCGMDTLDIITRMNGKDWLDRGYYEVFRCVKPDKSDKYKNAGAGIK